LSTSAPDGRPVDGGRYDQPVAARETGYAQTEDGVYLAYQLIGDGPIDVLYQPDWPGNIDMEWEWPAFAAFLDGLGTFARVTMHEHRGVGLSSRNVPIPNLETRVGDAFTVLDTVGALQAVLVGYLAAGSVNALLSVTRPERVSALVWLEPNPRTAWAPDNPWGRTAEELLAEESTYRYWGTSAYGRAYAKEQEAYGSPIAEVEEALFAKASRNACTPDVALDMKRMWEETDVRHILPTIAVPTLILAQTAGGDVDRAQQVAAQIPGAEFREIPGEAWTVPTMMAVVDEIRRFVGVERPPVELDTILSTVLFTDIVESSLIQARLGDARWKSLIERHHALVRQALGRWQGVENDTAGDGFYATFDGPARAVRCALEIVEGVREIGFEVRAGVHTGECTVVDGKIGGIGVSIGSRIAALAGQSQVLVSQTVRDLVAGSRLSFADVGEHELKGVAGRWRLFTASGGP
jgi:class 3 adenylate cyclase/pimeloyl-ACP methyl ester carboxylesterase